MILRHGLPEEAQTSRLRRSLILYAIHLAPTRAPTASKSCKSKNPRASDCVARGFNTAIVVERPSRSFRPVLLLGKRSRGVVDPNLPAAQIEQPAGARNYRTRWIAASSHDRRAVGVRVDRNRLDVGTVREARARSHRAGGVGRAGELSQSLARQRSVVLRLVHFDLRA